MKQSRYLICSFVLLVLLAACAPAPATLQDAAQTLSSADAAFPVTIEHKYGKPPPI